MRLKPDFERARNYAIDRLTRELAPALVYHSLAHTCDEVVPAVERFAARAGVRGDDLLLLRTAAYYHDLGFITHYAGHEAASVAIATAALPEFGYQPRQVSRISGMIMATKLPQSPHTPLERLLADADLDVLGHPNFLARNQALRAELASYGGAMTDEGWYSNQIRFIANHRYWTPEAASERDSGKLLSIELLSAQLAQAQLRPNRVGTT